MRTGYVDGDLPLFGLNQSAHGVSSDAATMSIAGKSGVLYTSHADNSVIAWDTGTMLQRWERSFLGELCAAPLLVDSQLFVPTGAGLFALDAATGEVLWQTRPEHTLMSSPLKAQGLLWCGTLDGHLLGISPETGAVEAQYSLHQQGFFTTAACDGERLVWGDPGGHVSAFDLTKGKMAWRYNTHHAILACPTIEEGHVFVGTGHGQLYALALDTGQLAWSTWLGGPLYTPTAVGANVVYAATHNGYLHILDRESGTSQHRHSVMGYPVGGPLVANNGVIIAGQSSWGSYVYGFSQNVQTDVCYANTLSTAPLLLDDILYIGQQSGGFAALKGERARKVEPTPAPTPTPKPTPAPAPKPAYKPKLKSPEDPRRAALLALLDTEVQSSGQMFRETPNRAASSPARGARAFDSKRWEFQLDGGVYATPIIVGDTTYLATFEGSLYAINTNDGSLRWKSSLGGQIWSTPAVVGGVIICANDRGEVFTVDTDDGRLMSTYPTGGEINASPVVVDGVLYLGNYSGQVFAYKLRDKHRFWDFQAAGDVHSSVAIEGELAVFGCREGYIYGVDRITGNLLWKYKTDDWVYSSPVIKDGVVYVGSDDHHFYVLDGLAEGHLLWKYKTDDEVVSCPAVEGEHVYVGSRDHHLYAFDRQYGTLLWKYRAEDYLYGSPVVAGDVVYFSSVDNYIYAIERFTGNLLWKYRCETHVWASPAVGEGLLIAVDKDGRVTALQDREAAETHRLSHGKGETEAPTTPTQKAHTEEASGPRWNTAVVLRDASLGGARRALLEQLLVRPYSLRLQDMARTQLLATFEARS